MSYIQQQDQYVDTEYSALCCTLACLHVWKGSFLSRKPDLNKEGKKTNMSQLITKNNNQQLWMSTTFRAMYYSHLAFSGTNCFYHPLVLIVGSWTLELKVYSHMWGFNGHQIYYICIIQKYWSLDTSSIPCLKSIFSVVVVHCKWLINTV